MRLAYLFIISLFASFTAPAMPQTIESALDSLDTALEKMGDKLTQNERFSYIEPQETDSLYSQSISALLHSGYINHSIGANELALADWLDALEQLTPDDGRFAYVARCIADYYEDYQSKNNKHLYYLTLSAIGDVTNGVKHSPALAKVGRILLRQGDYARARSYIMHSAATESTGKGYITEDEDLRYALSDLFKASEQSHHSHHIKFFTIIGLLILALAFCIYKYRQLKSRKKIALNTLDIYRINSEAQDVAIKQILLLCELIIESNDDFVRLVSRKIKVGQVQDLSKSIESGKAQSDRIEKFNSLFDEMFYAIHPTFKEQVNDLFIPDKKIELPEGPQLNAELRILAFLRLGIDEPAKINKFLGLSINTIYTYRNRAKNRAINRDIFEENVKNIDIKS